MKRLEMKKKSFLVMICFLVALLIGCHKKPEQPEETIPTKRKPGTVELPEESSLKESDLKVVSPYSEREINRRGKFITSVTDTD